MHVKILILIVYTPHYQHSNLNHENMRNDFVFSFLRAALKIHLGKIWEYVNAFALINKTPKLNRKYRIEETGMLFIYLY